ncbi:hypothetical protein O181_056057 [Austropuccinia psidii MF-1]|uniref:Uncharacterized protein n=1 Tax=Austropuccinia psidii MF-1 TaxID=1389203 RepID=A0A9Q3HU36_9BASI|nr:hypothetical protein [Austropuccinia psidii MF-1]
MYSGMPPYSCPGCLVLSRILMCHTQILMPAQDPDALHPKPCAVNPYTGSGLGLVQDPDVSHANPHACPESRCITPKTLCCKSLHRGSFLTMPTTPYTIPGSQSFTRKILTRVQAPNNSNNCLRQGSVTTRKIDPPPWVLRKF